MAAGIPLFLALVMICSATHLDCEYPSVSLSFRSDMSASSSQFCIPLGKTASVLQSHNALWEIDGSAIMNSIAENP